MMVRYHTLWKIPVLCICAGYLSFWLTIFMVSRFGIQILPDGSYTNNRTFSTILEIVLFLLTLGIGYLMTNNMTRKEVFWSATIIVSILFILQLTQLLLFNISVEMGNNLGMWLVYMTQWSIIIPYTIQKIIANSWIAAFLSCFIPYIFVLFGKKE